MKESVILIGGGYSLNTGLEKNLWNKIKTLNCWSLNYAFMTMPFLPSKELWVDINFFKNNTLELQKLQKQGVILVTKPHNHYAAFRNPRIITEYNTTREKEKYQGKEGITNNLIYTGRMGLVGFFALSLAIAEKYKEIFLCGFDFGNNGLRDKNTHYYQSKLKIISTGVGRPEVYRLPDNRIKREVDDFKIFSQEKDIKIWNVSPESNIPFFEKINYDNFFDKIKT